MGKMRDSDWSREILLRSDWLQPKVAMCTTLKLISKQKSFELESSGISFTLALHEIESKSKKIIL